MDNDIVELFFTMQRGKDMVKFDGLLRNIIHIRDVSSNGEFEKQLTHLCTFICHCRDICIGKGERDMSYHMIFLLHSYLPELACSIFRQFVIGHDGFAPFGGWNDIKYFCLFVMSVSILGADDPLISFAISLATAQLRLDLETGSSNVAKWIPREQHHRELYDKFVMYWVFGDCFSGILTSGMKKKYRQMVSKLTPVEKKTNRTHLRSLINPLIPSETVLSESYKQRFVLERENMHQNMFMGEYVKYALHKKMGGGVSDSGSCWINKKWSALLASFPKCYEGIPVVDIDIGTMDSNLYHAFGFAIFIAQKSGGMRILLLSGEPIWVDISGCTDFCSTVDLLWSYCEMRTCSRISFDVMNLLFDSMKDVLLEENVKLFLFSERFLFDWNYFLKGFDGRIAVIFWNIGSCVRIPCDFYIDDHKELFLMSGHMPGLMHPFSRGREVLMFHGSYSFICTVFFEKRYKYLGSIVRDFICSQTNSFTPKHVLNADL
jgi:hypothetical protein